jgi:hypothetical protein
MVSVFEWMSKRARRTARTPLAVTLALAAIAAGGGAIVPASSRAGEYHVFVCKTPSGESAPADGWSGSNTGPETFAKDTCAQPGGALMAALRAETARTANVDSATWSFAAPSGETLAGATLWRAGDADGSGAVNAFYEFLFAGPDNLSSPTSTFGECVGGTPCPAGLGTTSEPLSVENRLVVPSANLGSHLYFGALCGGISEYNCPNNSGDSAGYAAVVYLYAADLILEQAVGPTATNVSGELATAPTVSGTTDVAFSASDPGSGVYEAVFTVDGQVVQSTVVNENGGRCRNVGQTTDGLPAFLYVQPCLPSVSADVGFDTTKVSNGTHHLVVSVIDAAGNAATVLDRTIAVDNPPPPGAPNGTNASAQATMAVAWKGTAKDRLTTGYGHAETIVGRLTGPGGVPIVGARVAVLATPAYAGARVAAMASPITNADGRFSVQLPAGLSSRSLRLEYSSAMGSSPAVAKTLTLSVRAGVALSIAPRVSSVGRSIYFSGRLRGGPVPSTGKLLVLEARSLGGAWLEFDVVRSDARGRYNASYRFKFPGPANYQFRVLCEAEADYPFATGSSHVVGVFER